MVSGERTSGATKEKNMTTETEIKTDLAVANTIAKQIGGRAFFMMGTQHKTGTAKSLIFNVRGSPLHVTKIVVTLDDSDTYTVEFWKAPVSARAIIHGKQPVKLSEDSDIYAENLHAIIAKGTGLALSI
jgi:hypothetical protein